jgi:hypothetical protein
MRATYLTHLILLDLIILITFGEEPSLLSTTIYFAFARRPFLAPQPSSLVSDRDFTTSWCKVKLFLCLTKYTLRHEGVWGSGCIDQRILDLGTNWR